MNRAIFLAIPDIKLPDVGLTVEAIAKSYADNIYDKYEAQYLLLGNTFFNYKENSPIKISVNNNNKYIKLIKNFQAVTQDKIKK